MWKSTTMRLNLLLTAVLLALTLPCAHAQAPMRTVGLAELQKQDRFSLATAREWKLPALVSFELDGGQVIAGDSVRLAGWLINASAEPQLVVIYPAGFLGFLLQPESGTAKARPGPPMPPPAPLPPMALTLPAHSRFHIETTRSLVDWEWDRDKPREIGWSFNFWGNLRPRGRLPIPG